MSPARRVWRRLWGAICLIHPFPVATVVVTSGGLLVVAWRGVPPAGFLARALAAVLSTQVAIGALNDYLDRSSDALGQPWKPIPSGRTTPATALALVAAGLAGTLALAATFGWRSALLLAIATSGGLAYDLCLKPTPLSILGYLIGFLTLVTWIWLIAGRLTLLFFLVYPLGAVALVTVHLAQSFPDVESDRAGGQRGLAATLGVQGTLTGIRLGLGAMVVGAMAAAAASQNLVAGLATGAGALIGMSALLVAGLDPGSIERRRRLFQYAAVSVALLAIGVLMSLSQLIS